MGKSLYSKEEIKTLEDTIRLCHSPEHLAGILQFVREKYQNENPEGKGNVHIVEYGYELAKKLGLAIISGKNSHSSSGNSPLSYDNISLTLKIDYMLVLKEKMISGKSTWDDLKKLFKSRSAVYRKERESVEHALAVHCPLIEAVRMYDWESKNMTYTPRGMLPMPRSLFGTGLADIYYLSSNHEIEAKVRDITTNSATQKVSQQDF